MRPGVGFSPAMPQKCAGMRMEPPPSLPIPPAEQNAAMAAASPPLEPPGVRWFNVWLYFYGEYLGVPRNIKCSNRCAKPVCPGSTSLREPVCTTMWTATMLA